MLVTDSHEFLELYRGDKDYRLGQEMVRQHEDLTFVSFAPRSVSPVERDLLGKSHLEASDLPEFPDRMTVRLLPSAAFRFARKEVGGVFSFMPGYARALRRLSPDVILENPYTWLTPRSYATDRVARRFGIPVVYYDPGDDVPVSASQRLLLPLERPVVNRAAAIITYNAVGRDRFVEKYGYPQDRISIIPKPIDVPRWRRPDLREGSRASLGIAAETFVVACSGRLTRFRGSTTLAEAARAAVADARFRDVVFLFIGGPMGSDVDLAEYEGPNTIVTGMVTNDRVPALLAAADVVAFPDLTTKAGFTTALAEAMAAARPIIVGADAAQGAIPLSDGVDALYVPSGSPSDILEAVARLKADPALTRSLAESAGRRASDTMDYPRVARAYLDILERVVADARPL